MYNKLIDTHIGIFDWWCNISTCNVRLKTKNYSQYNIIGICMFYVLKWYYLNTNRGKHRPFCQNLMKYTHFNIIILFAESFLFW